MTSTGENKRLPTDREQPSKKLLTLSNGLRLTSENRGDPTRDNHVTAAGKDSQTAGER